MRARKLLSPSSPSPWLVLLLLVGTICTLGCRPLITSGFSALSPPGEEQPATAEESSASDTEAEQEKPATAETTASSANSDSPSATPVPKELSTGEWIIRITPPGEQPPADATHWRHLAIEELLARPADQLPDFSQWLKHPQAGIATNAAIVLAHSHDQRGVPTLLASVRAGELKTSQRRAAAEALGLCSSPAAQQAVCELLDQYGDFAGSHRGIYNSELHVDLLRAIGRQAQAETATRLTAALHAPAVEVRIAALKSWPQESTPPAAEDLAKLIKDPDARVRVEFLKLLARCPAPESLALVSRAVTDIKFEVRQAAIDALGSLGGPEAIAELQRASKHPAEGMRESAVKALAKLEAWDAALAVVEDESWHVRLALARELVHSPTVASGQALAKLLKDRSIDVQKAAVETLAAWPWPQGGPLLIDALDSPVFQTRETAAQQLGKAWQPAATFPYQGEPNDRVAAIVALQEKWKAEFPADLLVAKGTEKGGNTSPATPALTTEVRKQVAADVHLLSAADSGSATKAAACARLLELGESLPPALAELLATEKTTLPPELYDRVLPELDVNFIQLARLEDSEVTVRRRAAIELRQHAADHPLSDLALLRLAELVLPESDPLVWQDVEQLLAQDMREPAVRLHYAALNHPAPEVQRRACLYLGTHGDARHAVVLTAALEDENALVVQAAATSLGQLERLDNTLPLVRLLASRDRNLVLATAISLARQGEESGGDALERLALDLNPQIRRRAIEAMGTLQQARFVPSFILSLDDQLGTKQAALDGLKSTVGQNIGQGTDATPPPMAEQIRRWKDWHVRQEKAKRMQQR